MKERPMRQLSIYEKRAGGDDDGAQESHPGAAGDADGGHSAVTLQPAPAHGLRPSLHRAAAIRLPADPAEATAQALALIRGDSAFDRSGALEALRERVTRLTASDGDAVIEELGRQLAVLAELVLRYAAESVAAKSVEARARFAKISFDAQAAYTRTAVAIAGLQRQREGRAVVDVVAE